MRIYTTNNSNLQANPPHAVRDQEKFSALVAAFENGEDVAPVVVLKLGEHDDYPQAITGSHRIAAAREAGVPVPMIVIESTNRWQQGVLELILAEGAGDYNDKCVMLDKLASRMGWKKTQAALADQMGSPSRCTVVL